MSFKISFSRWIACCLFSFKICRFSQTWNQKEWCYFAKYFGFQKLNIFCRTIANSCTNAALLDWLKANAFQIKLIYLNCIFSVSSDFFCQKYLGKTTFPNQLAKDEIFWSGFSVFLRIFRSFRGTWSPRHDWICHVILRDFCVKFFTFFWWNSKIFWCNLSYKVSSWVAWK